MFRRPVPGFWGIKRNSKFIINLMIGFLFIVTAPSFAVAQRNDLALVGRAGTLGFGAEVHKLLIPEVLSFRAGGQFYRDSVDLTVNGIDYNAKLTLGTVPIALDIYPFKNWFRLNGGMMINFNGASGTAVPKNNQVTINDVPYTTAEIGQLHGSVKINRVAPFFGVGFGRTFKEGRHWGVTFDLGAMYQGEMKLSLATTLPASPQLRNDLRQQEQRFNNDVKDYSLFPFLQFGVFYRFGGMN